MANGQKVVITNLCELDEINLTAEIRPGPDLGGQLPVAGRLFFVAPQIIPGITAADALDANDQYGSLLQVAVPKKGVIVKALLHDVDNEGSGVEMWLHNKPVNLAASDAAFALADPDALQVIDVLTFATFKTATNNQIGQTVDTPCWYYAPDNILYIAFKTLSTPNIAAGSDPRVSLVIERYSDD